MANCAWRFRQKLQSQGTEVSGDVCKPKERSLRYLKRHWILGQPMTTELADLRSIWYYHTGSLLELLMISRAFEATDPRDKIYSVLGLAQTPLATDPSDKESMHIDYGASVSEVYQYTTKYLINRDRNLDVLCLISTHTNSHSDELPSWTLDWRVPISKYSLSQNWDYFTYQFGASGFSKCLAQDQSDLGRLVVEAFPIKRIEELLPLTPTTIPHPPETPAGDVEHYDASKHIRRFAIATDQPVVVPAAAAKGDYIFLLLGCKMPIALRITDVAEDKSPTAYVVGPCWVPAAMLGKEMEKFQDNPEQEAHRIILLEDDIHAMWSHVYSVNIARFTDDPVCCRYLHQVHTGIVVRVNVFETMVASVPDGFATQ